MKFFASTVALLQVARSELVEVESQSPAESYQFPRRQLASESCFKEFVYTNAKDWNQMVDTTNPKCLHECDGKVQSPLNYENDDAHLKKPFNTTTHYLNIMWNPSERITTEEILKCPAAEAEVAVLEKKCMHPNWFNPATCVCGGKAVWKKPKDTKDLSQKYTCHNCKHLRTEVDSPAFKGKGRQTFEVMQMHMHTPSENTINGIHAAGEIHFVHVNINPVDGLPNYLVIGIMLQVVVTGMDNEISPFAKSLFPKDKNGKVQVGKADLDAANWTSLFQKPSSTKKTRGPLSDGVHFWHNQGSLTTPPCTESVEWFVLETPLKVTNEMIDAYKNHFTKYTVTARPTQNKNNLEPIYYGSLRKDNAECCMKGERSNKSPQCPVVEGEASQLGTSFVTLLSVLLLAFSF